MRQIFDERYRVAEENGHSNVVVVKHGYMDTEFGVTLTSKATIDAARKCAETRREKLATKIRESAESEARKQERIARKAAKEQEKKQRKEHCDRAKSEKERKSSGNDSEIVVSVALATLAADAVKPSGFSLATAPSTSSGDPPQGGIGWACAADRDFM